MENTGQGGKLNLEEYVIKAECLMSCSVVTFGGLEEEATCQSGNHRAGGEEPSSPESEKGKVPHALGLLKREWSPRRRHDPVKSYICRHLEDEDDERDDLDAAADSDCADDSWEVFQTLSARVNQYD
ncbi:hypothetical protein H920_14770 [Fukomys damarensis]|uniref:Uncharacterized protein n=1 Tax=Fukomys damarensis TaxID=885580 RepID=A0A091CYP9_FUKDA|nr:hypothetical protein H920_14770 [Fukomys damarensis]